MSDNALSFTVQQTVELKPFMTPSVAVVVDESNARTIPVADVPPSVFDELVSRWVVAMYAMLNRDVTLTVADVVAPPADDQEGQ